MDCVLRNILMIVDVMDKDCLCRKPNNGYFEFPIEDDIIVEANNNTNSCANYINTCELKNKVIREFQDILKQLQCGIQPDLEFILQEISLIYIYDE